MFCRAVVAFLVLPGTFAFVIPGFLVGFYRGFVNPAWPGLTVMALGALILGWCVGAFYFQGRGTLAPWSPPINLVTTGLYRLSRNPMYVGVLLVVAGWSISYSSWILSAYTLALAILFHLRIVLGEEPALAKTFGEEWRTYSRSVPRWLGVLLVIQQIR